MERYLNFNNFRGIATLISNNVKIGAKDLKIFRNEQFQNEKNRQKSLITKIEKIKVQIKGPPQECSLIMNKNLSTPYDCAKHIHEYVTKRCALAIVNGKVWDIHKPLVEDSELYFLHFKDEDSQFLNKAFWRTGSFILGNIIENSFKDELSTDLHSWIPTLVNRCKFCYDFLLPFSTKWSPSQAELRILTKQANQFCWREHLIQPLTVDAKIAQKIFEHSKFKREQISKMAEESKTGFSVNLYRVDDHVDLSRGPMIANTRLFGRFDIVDVHDLSEKGCDENMYRAQAVALPSQLSLHQWTWNLLKKKASIPSFDHLPQRYEDLKNSPLTRLRYADPDLVKPNNTGWNEMHLPFRKESPLQDNAPNSFAATDNQNLNQGNLVHDTRLKFNNVRHQWEHRPVFARRSRPSIYVNSIQNLPKEYVQVPHSNSDKQSRPI
ncbi:unnamed protein product [Gordionus sp. m RMFG-2023]|uniref:large ribosomal subunit protein mL39-like n=1 Tax=Gordionus sp. m RMFG-2023 TaxID=3053472 RepID=UPI0030DF2C7E